MSPFYTVSVVVCVTIIECSTTLTLLILEDMGRLTYSNHVNYLFSDLILNMS